MAQPPGQPPAGVDSALQSLLAKGSGGGGKGGPLVTEHGLAGGPDAGILRNFFGSVHGHALINGVFTGAAALTTSINPTANGSVGGFALNKKVMNPLGLK